MTGGTMLGATDWAGIAAVIAAVFAGLASLISANNGRKASQIRTMVGTNGDSRELGKIASDVAKQIAPDPDPPAPPAAEPTP